MTNGKGLHKIQLKNFILLQPRFYYIFLTKVKNNACKKKITRFPLTHPRLFVIIFLEKQKQYHREKYKT